ncbi:L-histidine N(alpha)-methyltransferase [Rhodovibrio sodomensis]|uniref:L-histidine N(Alpha)-methyltransferase n=2 Tax=Rhodovibrio sodomensis TaxID=1088 RepID=A0ABS1D9X0_9PROT|nr:L-histidine N(alpha)-methyltransferase [Rhodovibrio sodomensis]
MTPDGSTAAPTHPTASARTHPNSAVRDVPPTRVVPSLRAEVETGFAKRPRELSPKHLYDARGAELFEQICALPEYYLTRTETALLHAHATAIIEAARPAEIVELGAGSARKTEILLAAAADHAARNQAPLTFWPMDVCVSALDEAAQRLRERFPRIAVKPLAGDHTAGLSHLPARSGARLFVFLGSTLGNFEPAGAQRLLGDIARQMGPDDRLLLGVDTVKDTATLEAAYNDAAGVTAAFNENLINVLNRELDGDLDIAGFRHRAVYNPELQRIESYLDATRAQTGTFAALDASHAFAPGDSIFTEISRKFTPDSLDADLAPAGLVRTADFLADGNRYALHVIARADA